MGENKIRGIGRWILGSIAAGLTVGVSLLAVSPGSEATVRPIVFDDPAAATAGTVTTNPYVVEPFLWRLEVNDTASASTYPSRGPVVHPRLVDTVEQGLGDVERLREVLLRGIQDPAAAAACPALLRAVLSAESIRQRDTVWSSAIKASPLEISIWASSGRASHVRIVHSSSAMGAAFSPRLSGGAQPATFLRHSPK